MAGYINLLLCKIKNKWHFCEIIMYALNLKYIYLITKKNKMYGIISHSVTKESIKKSQKDIIKIDFCCFIYIVECWMFI